jgi:hypothetical protein
VVKPGVAVGLARLAGLLKPALEIMWVEDVRRMNPSWRKTFLTSPVTSSAVNELPWLRRSEPLKNAFGARCFSCNAPLERYRGERVGRIR